MHVYVLVCVCVSVSIADWHAATLLSARQLVPKFVPHLPLLPSTPLPSHLLTPLLLMQQLAQLVPASP